MEISKVEIIDGECYVGMNMLENEIAKNKALTNENTNLKQALNEIREYCSKISNLFWVEDDEPKYVSKDILQITDKALGGNYGIKRRNVCKN